MNISIRSVFLLSLFGASATLGACGGYVNLGDPFMAGAGGEGASESEGVGGTTAGTGSGAAPASGGTAGTGGSASAEAGAGGETSSEAGAGGDASAQAGTSAGGTAGAPPLAPRTGSFKMLVYSRTVGFSHDSIERGWQMLSEIAAERDFEVTMTKTNEEITLAGLSQYEIVFFLNTTGDVLNDAEQQAFEEWMTTRNGAFAGVHSATDTEPSWAFYKELTGQYFDLHGPAGTATDIVIEDAASGFPGMADLPNPWPYSEEWYRFNQHAVWSAKPGFEILARNATDGHPISWIREFGNFRSFYTSLGHASSTFADDLVKTHIAGGIFWTVRREHLFE